MPALAYWESVVLCAATVTDRPCWLIEKLFTLSPAGSFGMSKLMGGGVLPRDADVRAGDLDRADLGEADRADGRRGLDLVRAGGRQVQVGDTAGLVGQRGAHRGEGHERDPGDVVYLAAV